MSPKSLLRHPKVVSSVDEFATGTKFMETIDDANADAKKVDRLLFCTGKVYFDLLEAKLENKLDNVAIVRLEQLYPFPEEQVLKILNKYDKAQKYWVQEESANMGAWSYLMRYWRRTDIELISRQVSASPASGFKKVHDTQQDVLVKHALGIS